MRYEGSEELKDKSTCAGLRADLKICLLESECCAKLHMTPRQCLMKDDDGTVPRECYVLKNAFFECKRAMLDHRNRFRGRRGY